MCNFSQQLVSLEISKIWIVPEEQTLKNGRGGGGEPAVLVGLVCACCRVDEWTRPPLLLPHRYCRLCRPENNRSANEASQRQERRVDGECSNIIFYGHLHVLLGHQCWPFTSLLDDPDLAFMLRSRDTFLLAAISSFLHPKSFFSSVLSGNRIRQYYADQDPQQWLLHVYQGTYSIDLYVICN